MSWKCVVLCFAALLVSGAAFAAELNPTAPGCEGSSLISFVDGVNTGGCSVGPFIIDNVQFNASGTGGATPAGFDDLTFTPVWNGNTLTIGLEGFNCDVPKDQHDENHTGRCDTSGDQTITYTFSFRLDPAPIIDSMDVSMDPPFGNIFGSVEYCGDPIIGTSGVICGQSGSGGIGIGAPFSTTFRLPLSTIITGLQLNLGPGTSGFDGLIYSYGTTLPEPGSWALLGSSLIALGGFSRRRRR